MQKEVADEISEGVKMNLLQNSVKGVDDLRRVKTDLNTLASRTSTLSSFKEYLSLLVNAAQDYDNEKITNAANSRRQKQNVLSHELDCLKLRSPEEEIQFYHYNNEYSSTPKNAASNMLRIY